MKNMKLVINVLTMSKRASKARICILKFSWTFLFLTRRQINNKCLQNTPEELAQRQKHCCHGNKEVDTMCGSSMIRLTAYCFWCKILNVSAASTWANALWHLLQNTFVWKTINNVYVAITVELLQFTVKSTAKEAQGSHRKWQKLLMNVHDLWPLSNHQYYHDGHNDTLAIFF